MHMNFQDRMRLMRNCVKKWGNQLKSILKEKKD